MMEDRVKNIIYRLYGLAESNYWTHYKEFIDREEVVAQGEQDDPEWCCDEWTMLRSDYNIIQDVKVALEEYYKDVATFVLPLEGKNEEAIQRLRENGGDTLTLEWPTIQISAMSGGQTMPPTCTSNYMSFEEFIHKKKAEIWDNCRYSGNWLCLYKTIADTVIIRVCNKKPNVKKSRFESCFDWTDFKEGDDYEDVCVDRDDVIFSNFVEATYVHVDDSFWDFGQTFSND